MSTLRQPQTWRNTARVQQDQLVRQLLQSDDIDSVLHRIEQQGLGHIAPLMQAMTDFDGQPGSHTTRQKNGRSASANVMRGTRDIISPTATTSSMPHPRTHSAQDNGMSRRSGQNITGPATAVRRDKSFLPPPPSPPRRTTNSNSNKQRGGGVNADSLGAWNEANGSEYETTLLRGSPGRGNNNNSNVTSMRRTNRGAGLPPPSLSPDYDVEDEEGDDDVTMRSEAAVSSSMPSSSWQQQGRRRSSGSPPARPLLSPKPQSGRQNHTMKANTVANNGGNNGKRPPLPLSPSSRSRMQTPPLAPSTSAAAKRKAAAARQSGTTTPTMTNCMVATVPAAGPLRSLEHGLEDLAQNRIARQLQLLRSYRELAELCSRTESPAEDLFENTPFAQLAREQAAQIQPRLGAEGNNTVTVNNNYYFGGEGGSTGGNSPARHASPSPRHASPVRDTPSEVHGRTLSTSSSQQQQQQQLRHSHTGRPASVGNNNNNHNSSSSRARPSDVASAPELSSTRHTRTTSFTSSQPLAQVHHGSHTRQQSLLSPQSTEPQSPHTATATTNTISVINATSGGNGAHSGPSAKGRRNAHATSASLSRSHRGKSHHRTRRGNDDEAHTPTATTEEASYTEDDGEDVDDEEEDNFHGDLIDAEDTTDLLPPPPRIIEREQHRRPNQPEARAEANTTANNNNGNSMGAGDGQRVARTTSPPSSLDPSLRSNTAASHTPVPSEAAAALGVKAHNHSVLLMPASNDGDALNEEEEEEEPHNGIAHASVTSSLERIQVLSGRDKLLADAHSAATLTHTHGSTPSRLTSPTQPMPTHVASNQLRSDNTHYNNNSVNEENDGYERNAGAGRRGSSNTGGPTNTAFTPERASQATATSRRTSHSAVLNTALPGATRNNNNTHNEQAGDTASQRWPASQSLSKTPSGKGPSGTQRGRSDGAGSAASDVDDTPRNPQLLTSTPTVRLTTAAAAAQTRTNKDAASREAVNEEGRRTASLDEGRRRRQQRGYRVHNRATHPGNIAVDLHADYLDESLGSAHEKDNDDEGGSFTTSSSSSTTTYGYTPTSTWRSQRRSHRHSVRRHRHSQQQQQHHPSSSYSKLSRSKSDGDIQRYRDKNEGRSHEYSGRRRVRHRHHQPSSTTLSSSQRQHQRCNPQSSHHHYPSKSSHTTSPNTSRNFLTQLSTSTPPSNATVNKPRNNYNNDAEDYNSPLLTTAGMRRTETNNGYDHSGNRRTYRPPSPQPLVPGSTRFVQPTAAGAIHAGRPGANTIAFNRLGPSGTSNNNSSGTAGVAASQQRWPSGQPVSRPSAMRTTQPSQLQPSASPSIPPRQSVTLPTTTTAAGGDEQERSVGLTRGVLYGSLLPHNQQQQPVAQNEKGHHHHHHHKDLMGPVMHVSGPLTVPAASTRPSRSQSRLQSTSALLPPAPSPQRAARPSATAAATMPAVLPTSRPRPTHTRPTNNTNNDIEEGAVLHAVEKRTPMYTTISPESYYTTVERKPPTAVVSKPSNRPNPPPSNAQQQQQPVQQRAASQNGYSRQSSSRLAVVGSSSHSTVEPLVWMSSSSGCVVGPNGTIIEPRHRKRQDRRSTMTTTTTNTTNTTQQNNANSRSNVTADAYTSNANLQSRSLSATVPSSTLVQAVAQPPAVVSAALDPRRALFAQRSRIGSQASRAASISCTERFGIAPLPA